MTLWHRISARFNRRAFIFPATLLAIEFFDELVYGAREAAWPLIRDDLGLTYTQVGLLLGVPGVVGNLVEPPLFILGDVWKRRALVAGGGLAFTGSLLLTAGAPSFWALLVAFSLLSPASGAFVSLSQASLMDTDSARHAQLMARWTLAGSLGVVAGSAAVAAAAYAGFGWRGLFLALAGLGLGLTILIWRQSFAESRLSAGQRGFRAAVVGALRALGRREVWRWLVLLEFADFMLDVLLGFLALYLVDVVGFTPAVAGTAVAVWTGAGLAGDALLIPLLERVRGLVYLRYSAAALLLLYPAFLLAGASGGAWPLFVLLALLGLGNSGWYAILQGQLYSSMPGRSGTAIAIDSAVGVVAALIPALLGQVAQRFGLSVAMWLLACGPVALLVGLPRTAVVRGERGGSGR